MLMLSAEVVLPIICGEEFLPTALKWVVCYVCWLISEPQTALDKGVISEPQENWADMLLYTFPDPPDDMWVPWAASVLGFLIVQVALLWHCRVSSLTYFPASLTCCYILCLSDEQSPLVQSVLYHKTGRAIYLLAFKCACACMHIHTLPSRFSMCAFFFL